MALTHYTMPSLAKRTTLCLGGTAEVELVVSSPKDLDELSMFFQQEQLRPFVLGKGSNLLCADGHHDLALIRVESEAKPEVVEQKGSQLTLRTGGGMRLLKVLGWAQKAGFSGLENLNGIPGTVGGAIAMNAGSYGTEIKDVVKRIQLWTPGQGLFWVDASNCQWGYRYFSPPQSTGKALIWAVELVLAEQANSLVKTKMQAAYTKKKETQPVAARSAGCIFKNPEGTSAGMLLDKAGFRGKRLGGVGFSEMHANFLINHGSGTSVEAIELIDTARETVARQFDVHLETEVIFL